MGLNDFAAVLRPPADWSVLPAQVAGVIPLMVPCNIRANATAVRALAAQCEAGGVQLSWPGAGLSSGSPLPWACVWPGSWGAGSEALGSHITAAVEDLKLCSGGAVDIPASLQWPLYLPWWTSTGTNPSSAPGPWQALPKIHMLLVQSPPGVPVTDFIQLLSPAWAPLTWGWNVTAGAEGALQLQLPAGALSGEAVSPPLHWALAQNHFHIVDNASAHAHAGVLSHVAQILAAKNAFTLPALHECMPTVSPTASPSSSALPSPSGTVSPTASKGRGAMVCVW